jgi:hypothetical protein
MSHRPLAPVSVTELKHLFHDTGLPFPPLPEPWLRDLKRLSPWVYSTRSIDISPYDIEWYVREAEDGSAPDYTLLAHTGHGPKGYAIHLFAVHGPLALFVQIGFGGPFKRGPQAAMRVARVFAEVDVLLEVLAEAGGEGHLPSGARYLILASDVAGSAWRRLEDDGPSIWSRRASGREIKAMQDAIASIRGASHVPPRPFGEGE